MEALLAGEIDVAYVGPSPAINTFLKSGGTALRLLAGACSGGAALVARGDVKIASIRDLDGKRVAVPQLGGTQDVSCRHFMAVNGLKSTDKGGTVEVLPVKNPDILALFKRQQIDAAWVPRSPGPRLVKDGGGRIVVDERDLARPPVYDDRRSRPHEVSAGPRTRGPDLSGGARTRDRLAGAARGRRPEALANDELKRLTGSRKAAPGRRHAQRLVARHVHDRSDPAERGAFGRGRSGIPQAGQKRGRPLRLETAGKARQYAAVR